MSEERFNSMLKFKRDGGTPYIAHLSTSIWLGGLEEGRAHQPFVAIGPENWDTEEELMFFKDQKSLKNWLEDVAKLGTHLPEQ